MGWKTGFEPATLGITIRCSNQLSYIHHKVKMARPTGIEPVTAGLEGRCSIQLSYGRSMEILHRTAPSGKSVTEPGWSGLRDSNPRPSGPKPDALPDCAKPRQGNM